MQRAGDPALWDAVESIDDGELWEAHLTLKARLVAEVRRRLVRQAERLDEPATVVAQVKRVLSRDALTIGVARRFATYKRAILLLRDLEALEACGTSGQKVVLNGALNLSVLDGWWAEAYDGRNGFAIGRGETHTSVAVHDARDAGALAQVLREEVIPLYYDRDADGLPRTWIARVKRAIRTLGWRFSADRMVMDYVLRAYIPAAGGTSSDLRGF
jgi:glucan phosphorylase